MGTYMSSGAEKKGSTTKKVAVVGNNTATFEEEAANGARGHINEFSDMNEIEKTEEEEVGVILSDEDSTDEDSDDEDESEFSWEVESKEEAEERAKILADAVALKKLATDYMHPEVKVATSHPSTFGRNYFSRPSAVEVESKEEADERAQILADAAALKKVATDYMHPEIKVWNSDPSSHGRNYFSRPSAVVLESKEEADERAQILADAAALKKLATDYMHPEVNVSEAHPCAFGRNYFNRPSAVEVESKEEADERAQILADAAALKKLATDYMHPEIKVTTSDPCVVARNFFDRPSAVESESKEEAEERAQILADAAALKKLATDYMHPEIKVTTSDPYAFGRNYFMRAAALDIANPESSHRERAESIFSIDDPLADMDETALDEMRSKFNNLDMGAQHLAHTSLVKRVDEITPADLDAGKISRSPSSVALFGLEECA